jgi:hypothetical protein
MTLTVGFVWFARTVRSSQPARRLPRRRARVNDFRPAGHDGLRPNQPHRKRARLLLDRIKRDKGVWWMPWQQEAMKDVALCDKPGGGESTL